MKRVLKIGVISVASLILVSFSLVALLTRPPSREEVEQMFWSSVNKIYAYEAWDNTPYMLFSTKKFGLPDKLYFDRILIARQYPHFPWILDRQWSGDWYYIPYTEAPASLGKGYCPGELHRLPPNCKDTDVFGQINDRSITTLELNLDGKWQQHSVSYPGFAIRINNFLGEIADYRWLNNSGEVIWTKAQDLTVTLP